MLCADQAGDGSRPILRLDRLHNRAYAMHRQARVATQACAPKAQPGTMCEPLIQYRALGLCTGSQYSLSTMHFANNLNLS